MTSHELCINSERLREDMDALARIGRRENHGIYRMAFSDGDMAGRDWLRQRIEESGLEFFQDGAANLYARLNPDVTIPSVIAGSHMDTVPGAGAAAPGDHPGARLVSRLARRTGARFAPDRAGSPARTERIRY